MNQLVSLFLVQLVVLIHGSNVHFTASPPSIHAPVTESLDMSCYVDDSPAASPTGSPAPSPTNSGGLVGRALPATDVGTNRDRPISRDITPNEEPQLFGNRNTRLTTKESSSEHNPLLKRSPPTPRSSRRSCDVRHRHHNHTKWNPCGHGVRIHGGHVGI